MLLLVVGVMLAGLQVSYQIDIEYPGPAPNNPQINRYYSDHGGYSNNCPITVCDHTVCPNGFYLASCGGTSAGDCTSSCTGLPDNAVWSSNGGTSPTGCSWVCDVNYVKNGNGCSLKECANNNRGAIQNSTFLGGTEGSFPNCKYQCNAGYIGAGSSADGLLRGPASCSACPAGTAAALGVPTCSDCGPGYFSASAGSAACSMCDAGLRKYSTLNRNTECSSCTTCPGNGYFRQGCGFNSTGTCETCSNTQYSSTP
jgi:hypothetical protein